MSENKSVFQKLKDNSTDLLVWAMEGIDSLTHSKAARAVSGTAGLLMIAKAGDTASMGEPWNDFLLATGGAALLAIAGRGPKRLLNILCQQGKDMGARTPSAADLRDQGPLPPNVLREKPKATIA